MKLLNLSNEQLQLELLSLMDEVFELLKHNSDIDKFLDETKLFDPWEEVLPEAEFPIFIMAVLNNTRRKPVIDSIINAVRNQIEFTDNLNHSKMETVSSKPKLGDHPFS
tara:strand:+ start:2411 stop:2737 length:327 start_codon:yes stop_codon:yes gene_type:complete